MMPRPHYYKILVVIGVLRLKRFVDGYRAVNIFLIPQAVYQHGRNFQRLRGKSLVHGLLLPPGVVGRMLENLSPEADLLETAAPAKFTCRAGFPVHVVVVEVTGPPVLVVLARGCLPGAVGHVLLA